MSLRAQCWTAGTLAIVLAIAGCKSSTHSVTGVGVDVTAPTIVATNPIDGTVGVAVITAAFSEPMDASTISASSFLVTTASGTPVAGTVTYDASANVASFVPSTPLALGTAYRATVTTAAKDAAGNAMAAAKVWSFATASVASVQTVPSLGTSASYAVLAATGVTSTGATQLTGDLGVSSAAGVVTGFPPGTVSGATHVRDQVAATAIASANAAYNDVVSRATVPVTVTSDLSGLSLPPGFYRSTSAMLVTKGTLTLDGRGDPNSVFIFQTSSLVVNANRSVILTNGARAANVFWQVNGAATLAASSTFAGTILATQSITMANASSLSGRAISTTRSVTLANSTVVAPSLTGTLLAGGITR